MMGQAAAETEAGQLLALLTANAGAGVTMGDGKALFHADHGNLAALGLSWTFSTWTRRGGRAHPEDDGRQDPGERGSPVLGQPFFGTVGRTDSGGNPANTTADVNPFGGKLSLIVEPRLTGNGWYLFGDPATAPVLEYAYLSSAQGPGMSSRDGWEVLGREFPSPSTSAQARRITGALTGTRVRNGNPRAT